LLEDLGAVPQLVNGHADIGTHCLMDELVGRHALVRIDQRDYGWPNPIDDRPQIS
jgi:hypothetical protein